MDPPMARISPRVLRRYLFGGYIPNAGCARWRHALQSGQPLCVRQSHTTKTSGPRTEPSHGNPSITAPSYKRWKDRKIAQKQQKEQTIAERQEKLAGSDGNEGPEKWELTVGIEVHAQLNTARKLFSSAASTINEKANTHISFFDLAIPGSQPIFQQETLIPALRAALALNCEIQKVSKFDRKHYFHWDQPAGYQITQYYEPFAKDGHITLYAHDGIAKEDGKEIRIGIKQIQMEQDTAKTISLPGDIHLLDFNRVGLPLIEIITLPQIHYPATAAALVRKLQIILSSVDACVLGMESGGLRADVNVSMRRVGETEAKNEYAGVKGLGQRTEIKNLSSFKAVEDAIIAERNRQIRVLEEGGRIEGETRGWTIGSSETVRLRAKEGEVDYRYMPDPDIAPVVIGQDLLNHLQTTLGVLPDEEIATLVKDYDLTTKDALSIVALEDGGRAEFFYGLVDEFLALSPGADMKTAGRLCANWVLHEMGGLTHASCDDSNPLRMNSHGVCAIPQKELAKLLHFLDGKRITGKTAKKILGQLYMNGISGKQEAVENILDNQGLWFTAMSEEEYRALATSILDMKVVKEILAGKEGKINYLLGQMMRKNTDGRVDPKQATAVLKKIIEEYREVSGSGD